VAVTARLVALLALTHAYLLLQLLVAGCILFCNVTMGGPLLGFALTSSLNLVALFTLYASGAAQRYLGSKPNDLLTQ
jgi:hypothetical protein